MISVDQIDKLDLKAIEKIYTENVNPGLVHYYKILGFNKILIKRAQGVYYYDQDEEKIFDFAGGVGAAALGHNHPRIIKARKKFQEEERHQIGQWFYSQYAAALSKNLATICPGDLDVVLLGNCGSEVIEGALKIVEKYQGPSKSKCVYASNSFHGRTRGALSLTDSPDLRSTFKMLGNHIKVPFGDADAMEKTLKENPDIGGVFLEAIQGGAGVIIPPEGYLRKVRELCDEFRVLLVLDEIQCGLGRPGKLFAFEYEDIIPDILAIAKPLSGSNSAIAALITRKPVYQKAFSSPKEWHINSPSTFGGMGEACVTAIETINIIFDENLIENAREMGDYFLEKLKHLSEKYPKMVKEVRGRGLIIGIEFYDISHTLVAPLQMMMSIFSERLKGSLAALIGAILLRNYKIIINFTGTNRNVIRLHPPYITKKEHIDYFINSLDEILGTGIGGIAKNFVKLKI